MKKVMFLFLIFALLLGASCKKKVAPIEAPPPPPPPPKITEQQFLLDLRMRDDVKNLKWGDSLVVTINPNEVLSPSSEFAIVKPFKADYEYHEMLALLKKLPLSVVWVGRENVHLLVMTYLDLPNYYKSGENFLVLDPKPVCSVKVGNKEYWLSKDGKFWKTW